MNFPTRNMTSENLKEAHENADDEESKLKHSYEAFAMKHPDIRTSSPNKIILNKVEELQKTVYSHSVSDHVELGKMMNIDSKTNAVQLKTALHSFSLEENYNKIENVTEKTGISENCFLSNKFRQDIPLNSINMESQKIRVNDLEVKIQKDDIQNSLDNSEVTTKRIKSRISVKTNLCVYNNSERLDCTLSYEAENRCSSKLLDRPSRTINDANFIKDDSKRISIEVPTAGTNIDQIVPYVKSEPVEQSEKEDCSKGYSNVEDSKFADQSKTETSKSAGTDAKSRFIKSELVTSACTDKIIDKCYNKDEFCLSPKLKTALLEEKTISKGNMKIGDDKMVMFKNETSFGDIIESDTMKCLKNIETEYENDILNIKKEVSMIRKEKNIAQSGPVASCVKQEMDDAENEVIGESDLRFNDSNLAKIRNSLQEEVLLKNENEDDYDDSSVCDDGTIQIEIESIKDEIVEESTSLGSRTSSTSASLQPGGPLPARPPMMLYQPSTPSSALVMQILPMNLLAGTQPNFLPILSTSAETILPTTLAFGVHQNRFITHTIRAGQSEGEVITDSVSSNETSRMDNLMLQQDAYGLLEPKLLTKFANFKCPQCGKTYLMRKPYENHIRYHNITDRKVAKELQKSMVKRLQAAKVIATRFRVPIEEQTDEFLDSISRKGKFYCKYCKKCYLFFGQAKRHEGFCLEAIIREEQSGLTDLDLDSDGEVSEAHVPKEYACVCGQKYLRRSRLETCLRSHDSAQVTCGMCRKLFPSKIDYQKHRRETHFKRIAPHDKQPETLVYKCKFCPAMFNTQGALIKHLKMHKKRQLEQLQEISKRLNVTEDRECFICSEKFTTDIFLREHLEINHSPPYVCKACNLSCDTIPNYCEHTKRSHTDVDTKSIDDALRASKDNSTHWTCSVCSESFTDSNKFLAHTRSHRKRASTDQKTSITKFRFHCQHCDETFPTLGALTYHRNEEHDADSTKAISKSVNDETVSINSAQAVKMDVEIEVRVQTDKRMCVNCRKMCRNMEALAMHMRFHSIERVCPCKYCGFRFSNNEKLKKHESIHTGTLKFVCFICEYRCATQNKLVKHKQSSKHEETKRALLESWPNFDRDLSEMTARKKLETSVESVESDCEKLAEADGDGKVMFSCDLCNEKFESDESMSQHKLATHPFIEFPDDKSQRIFFK